MTPSCLATSYSVELAHASSIPANATSTSFALGSFTFALEVTRRAENVGVFLRHLSSPAGSLPSSTEALPVAFQFFLHSTNAILMNSTDMYVRPFGSQSGSPSRGCSLKLSTLKALRSAQAQGYTVAATVYVAVECPTSTAAVLADAANVWLWQSPRTFLQAFWSNSDFSDCTVRMGDAPVEPDSQSSALGVFKCHRVILAAASPVLGKLFSGSMKEAAQQELIIHDTEPEALELLLLAAYGKQQLSVPLPLLLPLIKLADQYQMACLLNAATAWLKLTKQSPAALAVLVPQAVALGLADIAEFLAKALAAMVDDNSLDNAALLADWQLEHVGLLLQAADGSFGAFKAALCWSQKAAVRGMSALEAGGAAAPAGSGARQTAAPIALEEQADHSPELGSGMPWALLLPLVRFKAGFTAEQLVAARSLPGADSIPGLETCLLEAWEELHSKQQQG